MTDRELMQMALDAMAKCVECGMDEEAIHLCVTSSEAIRAALAQPKQEPVAWRTFDGEGDYDYRSYEMNENYAAEWAKRNPNHAHWVEPLFLKD